MTFLGDFCCKKCPKTQGSEHGDWCKRLNYPPVVPSAPDSAGGPEPPGADPEEEGDDGPDDAGNPSKKAKTLMPKTGPTGHGCVANPLLLKVSIATKSAGLAIAPGPNDITHLLFPGFAVPPRFTDGIAPRILRELSPYCPMGPLTTLVNLMESGRDVRVQATQARDTGADDQPSLSVGFLMSAGKGFRYAVGKYADMKHWPIVVNPLPAPV